jgi:hypothetical protein
MADSQNNLACRVLSQRTSANPQEKLIQNTWRDETKLRPISPLFFTVLLYAHYPYLRCSSQRRFDKHLSQQCYLQGCP